jgi:putative flippase GtrA
MPPKITWKDYLAAAIIGELVAWLTLAVAKGLQSGAVNALLIILREKLSIFGFLPIIFPIGAVIALVIFHLLAKKIPVLLQIFKFGLVGVLNTFVDLGVLNFLIFVSGFTAGIYFSVFKGISFIVAVVNSYFWNKFWTFKVKNREIIDQSKKRSEFAQFLAVSVIGFLVNVGVASLVVNVIGPVGEIDVRSWANIGAIAATLVALAWNFLGYKFFVFKR